MFVDLSMGEHTRFGTTVLYPLLYGNYFDEMKGLLEHVSGCPHTGGQHSLQLKGSEEDILAWLDLLEERYSGGKDELEILRMAISMFGSSRFVLRTVLHRTRPELNWQWLRKPDRVVHPLTDKVFPLLPNNRVDICPTA